jgi:predicted GH43/DUF377 family glycosyl hydrolase
MLKQLFIIGSILLTHFSFAQKKYADGRPEATLRMDAKDQGIVLKYGHGPDSCDVYGARDVWVFNSGDNFYMHYDAAGPKGWLASLAISKDLTHWTKKGPILDLGKEGENDSKTASYATTYFDGKDWHMFYVGSPNTTPAPDRIPAFPYLNLKAKSKSPTGPWIKQKNVIPFLPKPNSYYSSTISPGPILKEKDRYVQFFSCADYTIKRTISYAYTKNLDSTWTVAEEPILSPDEQIENVAMYYEKINGYWFLFTNHVGYDQYGEYTDALWVYWSKDLYKWEEKNKAIVLDGKNCTWSKLCIGLPSVLTYKGKLAIFYDAPENNSVSHMKRSIGLAWLKLPLIPPVK